MTRSIFDGNQFGCPNCWSMNWTKPTKALVHFQSPSKQNTINVRLIIVRAHHKKKWNCRKSMEVYKNPIFVSYSRLDPDKVEDYISLMNGDFIRSIKFSIGSILSFAVDCEEMERQSGKNRCRCRQIHKDNYIISVQKFVVLSFSRCFENYSFACLFFYNCSNWMKENERFSHATSGSVNITTNTLAMTDRRKIIDWIVLWMRHIHRQFRLLWANQRS